MIYAILCFMIWGLSPMYWKQLLHISSFEILAHRVIWASVILSAFFLLKTKKIPFNKKIFSPWVGLSSLLIFCNWITFVWATNNGFIVEASIGYYLAPLLSVFIGVKFLGESLSKRQLFSVLLALVGVILLCLTKVGAPWVSIVLFSTFGLYGLARKKIPVTGLEALWVEATFSSIFLLLYLFYLATKVPLIGFSSGENFAWVFGGGIMTILPLYYYGKAIDRLPLSTIGILNYLAPTLQFCLGVFLYNEQLDTYKKVALFFILSGVICFVSENIKGKIKSNG